MNQNMTNLEIAELLRSVAAAFELKNADKNRFRIIAYERAADAVEHESSELKDLWDEGKLKDVPGIGESIAMHLDEIFRTGKSKHLKDVMSGLPKAMFKLMEVPGIGAKTSFKLVKELNISDKNPFNELKKAIKEGKVNNIEGFGEKSASDILQSIEEQKNKSKRILLPYAQRIADEILEWINKDHSVVRAEPLGSLRRKASTIGDIDIAVASKKALQVIEHFCNYPKRVRVLERGERTASIILPSSIQVDLMVQSPESFGSLLQHFTGSKHHNIALREYSIKKGMSLSEYGIKQKGKLLKFKDEEGFYKKLGMEYIPPELREDSGEIEAALQSDIPKLVEIKDIKGDLQIHSDFDIETSHDLGESSMEEIVQKANDLGYEYIALTEHNPSQSGHNKKQFTDILKRKKEKIDKINYSISKDKNKRIQYVFNSLEIDILTDGKLPFDDEVLDILDFALVSIHSSFRKPKDEMTKRVLGAFDHKKVKIFAHPTARLLNERESIELDWPRIFDFCKSNKKYLEIDADPKRLDLPDFLVKEAVDSGVKLSMGTDAHHKNGMDNMIWGISVARRGWTKSSDIINTLSVKEIKKVLLG